MSHLYEPIQTLAEKTVKDITGLKSDILIIQATVNSSALYQDIHILFSYDKDHGIFRTDKELRLLRYDYSNNCGVMAHVSSKEDPYPRVIKVFGEQELVAQKGWL